MTGPKYGVAIKFAAQPLSKLTHAAAILRHTWFHEVQTEAQNQGWVEWYWATLQGHSLTQFARLVRPVVDPVVMDRTQSLWAQIEAATKEGFVHVHLLIQSHPEQGNLIGP